MPTNDDPTGLRAEVLSTHSALDAHAKVWSEKMIILAMGFVFLATVITFVVSFIGIRETIENRTTGYSNRATACQALVYLGDTKKTILPGCLNKHVLPLYSFAPQQDTSAFRVTVETLVCDLALRDHIKLPPSCNG